MQYMLIKAVKDCDGNHLILDFVDSIDNEKHVDYLRNTNISNMVKFRYCVIGDNSSNVLAFDYALQLLKSL